MKDTVSAVRVYYGKTFLSINPLFGAKALKCILE
jgi:hypothetical protein